VNIFPLVGAVVALLLLANPLSAADPVTYSRDVAPILFRHCTACHRPGEIGPPFLNLNAGERVSDLGHGRTMAMTYRASRFPGLWKRVGPART